MTWCAPSVLSFFAFASDEVVAMTVAPAARANYVAFSFEYHGMEAFSVSIPGVQRY